MNECEVLDPLLEINGPPKDSLVFLWVSWNGFFLFIYLFNFYPQIYEIFLNLQICRIQGHFRSKRS